MKHLMVFFIYCNGLEEMEKAISFCQGSQNVLELLFAFLDLFYARRGISGKVIK
jgi:hypothetical protein